MALVYYLSRVVRLASRETSLFCSASVLAGSFRQQSNLIILGDTHVLS
jgi:hypothetical protein